VLSYCRGGSLCDTMGKALETECPLPEGKVHVAFVQLCGALHYCHRHGVVHRDIKLDNLCWTDTRERTLMLIDFGYAATANEQTNFADSPAYAAPEVHHALQPDSPPFMCTQTDVWSAGVCLFAMLATSLPFNGSEDSDAELAELRRKVCAGVWDVQITNRPPEAVELVTALLKVDPAERFTLDEVCEHSWIGGQDQIPWRGFNE